MTDPTAVFEAERVRLTRIAAHVLGDPSEAEDVVQQAWLRWNGVAELAAIENPPGWLTTVTTRLCLDRLRLRLPVPEADLDAELADLVGGPDPADDVVLADTVGAALQVVLERLTPRERVAFVLHDSLGFGFEAIAGMLDTNAASARKLASRARAKVTQPAPQDALADWEVVDAFLAAARGGDLTRLLTLLAPDALVTADAAALQMGTPARIEGRDAVASFFDGAAKAAFPALVGARPGAAWIQHGRARVAFDFTVVAGRVAGIVFRAEPEVLDGVVRRSGAAAAE